MRAICFRVELSIGFLRHFSETVGSPAENAAILLGMVFVITRKAISKNAHQSNSKIEPKLLEKSQSHQKNLPKILTRETTKKLQKIEQLSHNSYSTSSRIKADFLTRITTMQTN